MKIELFDVVKLNDGTTGTIVDVWNAGRDYEFEPSDHSDLDQGAPLTYAISQEDISEIFPFEPMCSMGVFGVRYESDTKGEFGQYIIDSVTLANDALSGEGKRFYFDSIDVEQKEIGGFFCWDMYGWIVDDADSGAFEPLWRKGDGSALEGYDYALVTWRDDKGVPVPVFDAE